MTNGNLFAAVTNMLAASGNEDNCLVLAYGYLDSSALPKQALWQWLNAGKHRHLLLVTGIHGKKTKNAYLQASEGEQFAPMRVDADKVNAAAEGAAAVLDACGWAPGTLGVPAALPNRVTSPRLHVLISEHFHAKLAMTVVTDHQPDFHTAMPHSWRPTAAILGSSNMTHAAQQYNIELDVVFERSETASLNKLGTQSARLLASAITAAKTEDSASCAATELSYDITLDRLIDAEFERGLEKKKRQRAHLDAGRTACDKELD